jgi:DNA-binding transcriptional LysR family regulator
MQILHYDIPMDLKLFQDLERLQQTGNFSHAAGLSNLSQPAFSRRIKSIEAWVGVSLVDRSRQPVKLTPAGTQILEAGLQALTRIEQERSQIRQIQSLPDQYVISFGAQHSIGWRFYPAWLQALEGAYGPILSRLRADDLPNCMRDLARGDVDFVIAYASRTESFGVDGPSVLIGADQLIPVCKPSDSGRPIFAFDIEGFKVPFLQFGHTAPIADHLTPLLRQHGLYERLHTIYENSMAGALRIRARAGDGVAWLPKSLVQPDLDAGLLVQTGEPDWTVDLSIRLFRHEAHSKHATRAIWSYLKKRENEPLLESF